MLAGAVCGVSPLRGVTANWDAWKRPTTTNTGSMIQPVV
jgi:hypothetical protein